MKKLFFNHLVEIESVIVELDKMDLSDKERLHLASLIDSSLYHTILDAILSELGEEDKRLFLMHIQSDDHDKIWQFLNEKVDNIEEKIKKASEGLVKEMHEDVRKAKKS